MRVKKKYLKKSFKVRQRYEINPAFIKIAFNTEQNVKAQTMTFVSKNAMLNCTPRYDISNDSDIQVLDISSNVKNFIIFNVYNENLKAKIRIIQSNENWRQ